MVVPSWNTWNLLASLVLPRLSTIATFCEAYTLTTKSFITSFSKRRLLTSHLVLALLGFAAGNPKKTEAVHVVNIANLQFSTILPQLQVSVNIIFTLIRIDTIWVEVKANKELAPRCGAWQVEGELLIL